MKIGDLDFNPVPIKEYYRNVVDLQKDEAKAGRKPSYTHGGAYDKNEERTAMRACLAKKLPREFRANEKKAIKTRIPLHILVDSLRSAYEVSDQIVHEIATKIDDFILDSANSYIKLNGGIESLLDEEFVGYLSKGGPSSKNLRLAQILKSIVLLEIVTEEPTLTNKLKPDSINSPHKLYKRRKGKPKSISPSDEQPEHPYKRRNYANAELAQHYYRARALTQCLTSSQYERIAVIRDKIGSSKVGISEYFNQHGSLKGLKITDLGHQTIRILESILREGAEEARESIYDKKCEGMAKRGQGSGPRGKHIGDQSPSFDNATKTYEG